MAVMRALGLQSLLLPPAAAPSCLKSLCSSQRLFFLRNSPSPTQSDRVLKSRFLSSRRSLQGACLASPVAAGAATLAVVTASASQQVTQMAPGQSIRDKVGDGVQLPDLMTEFMVDMKCEGCVKSVRTKLEPLHGVRSVDISLENQVVRVLGSATLKNLTAALVESGRNARLIGQGVPEKFALTAAVAEFKGPYIHGVVRIAQVSMELVRIEASFNGLTPGLHGWSINDYGDLTCGAASTGGIFNGSAESQKPDSLPAGDLGVLEVTNEGSAEYTGTKEMLLVGDLIGRALVVYDDLDKSKPGITAAVIARSAGVGENYKKLCSCDGTVIWESTDSDYVKASL